MPGPAGRAATPDGGPYWTRPGPCSWKKDSSAPRSATSSPCPAARRSTLYEQFGDKDGLFETAIMLKCSEFIARMREIPLDDGDPERALTEFGLKFTECVLSPESPKFLRLLIASGDQFPKVIDAFFTGAPDAVRQILADYLREATKRGQLHVTDPDHAATTFLGFLHGDQQLKMLLRPERLATPEELKAFVEGVVRIFLDGVR